MPRFCANLNFLFTEVPLIERLDAAAKAGFKAVEIGSPYEVTAVDLAARLKANGLALALINTTAGDGAEGERGRSALAGREKDFDADLETALAYCAATGCKLIHVMAGLVHQGARRETLRRQSEEGGAQGCRCRRDAASSSRSIGATFPATSSTGSREARAIIYEVGAAQPWSSVRHLSPAGRGRRRGRRHEGVRGPHPSLPDRQPARSRRA